MNNKKYLIIHGHFYQPPRENPWFSAIEHQKSAAPFKNWNEKISQQCYATNGQSRTLNNNGQIRKILNNYSYLSFNFGPTLLSWLEYYEPLTYKNILEADKLAIKKYNGHGSALAQVYNHIIMPLATEEDRRTQIKWGIEDFIHRFKRKPEGMWLSETAVDLNTLKLMSQEGLKFTILSQTQAHKVRKLNLKDDWQELNSTKIDPRQAYRTFWGNGENDYIDLFFYDGNISRAIAFENLLSNGENFLNRIKNAYGDDNLNTPRLVNLATDGETYGHHFKFGDMAIAWLFDHLENDSELTLTNYGEFLELFPPSHEVIIHDNSSWSCAHGVERWRSNCGCTTGHMEWNQNWRAPLRDSLNILNSHLKDIYFQQTNTLLKNPIEARNAYINIILNKYSPKSKEEFFKNQQNKELTAEEKIKILGLMEGQLMALYMFTSCGWFFDDISGLEPVQILRYALRGIELYQGYSEINLEEELLSVLEQAVPNNPQYKTTKEIWEKLIVTDSLDNYEAAAHFVSAKIFNSPEVTEFFKAVSFQSLKEEEVKTENPEKLYLFKVQISDLRTNLNSQKNCFVFLNEKINKISLNIYISQEQDSSKYFEEALKQIEINSLQTENIETNLKNFRKFTFDDLLNTSQSFILKNLLDQYNKELKENTQKSFKEYSDIAIKYRSLDRPANWIEKFVFRVVGRREIQKILNPQNLNCSLDFELLEKVLSYRGIVGLSLEDSDFNILASNFLKAVFSNLENKENNRHKTLSNILKFLEITNSLKASFDLWIIQNSWLNLKNKQLFYSELNLEEKDLFTKVGTALNFNLT